MKSIALRMAAFAFTLLLTAACSGPTTVLPQDSGFEARRAVAGFSADCLPQCLVAGGSLTSVDLRVVTGQPNETRIAVSASDAQQLKALIIDIHYDPAQYTPAGIETTNLLGERDQLLELTVLDDPGTVHLGQVLIKPEEQTGFSGCGTVATISFLNKPYPVTKRISTAPWTDASRIQLHDSVTGHLTWRHTNQGDCDQNGLVSAADLVPIALYYGDSFAPVPFAEDDVRFVVDGDGNGGIFVSDITYVGMNFNNSILGGFNIYQSGDPADYPQLHNDENGDGTVLLGNLPLDQIDPSEPLNERRFYEYLLALPQADVYYWIRPVDGDGNEGIASTLLTNFGIRAPRDDLSQAPARLDGSNNTLVWYYYNTGDTNQDGVVSVSDFVAVSGLFNIVGPFDPNRRQGLADVNGDNVINQADIDLINTSLEKTVAGYNIYRSSNPEDYPSANNEDSAISPLASLAFSEGIEQPDRRFFVYETTEPNEYHWVRPYDELGNEGTPSILQQPLDPDAHVPLGGSSATVLSWDGGAGTCSWGYYNAGDYNQNGLVESQDLTVTGVHFGKTGPFAPDSIEAVIDGNRDEEISALDIDLVGKYHNQQVTGYNIYLSNVAVDYAFGSTNPSVIDAVGSVAFVDASGNGAVERLRFGHLLGEDPGGYYLWVRPYNADGLEGIASNLVVIDN